MKVKRTALTIIVTFRRLIKVETLLEESYKNKNLKYLFTDLFLTENSNFQLNITKYSDK